jgi:hypothetical protein
MQLLLDFPLNAPQLMILAYLDPGTGSYALQILLATMFGGMFALKQSWNELKLWLSSRFGDPLKSTDPNTNTTPRPATGVRSNDLARPGVHGHSTAKIQ